MKPGYRAAIGVGTLNITERAKQLVLECLDNNRLSYGPMTQKLENQFARIHGSDFGIMSNSGTSALQIALQAMKEQFGWADGDEVIVPACTFVATANIVLHNKMIPVLVDVDPIYYELDPEKLEAAISPKTRAVIPVHLFGQPADMDPICAIAKAHDLRIIEDSAETMFANYKGRPVGSLGDIGCFSTYAAHLLITGVGGFNTTNNPEFAVRLRSLMNHGRDSIYISIDDDKGKSGEELKAIVARRFKFVSVGHSFRSTEMEAALGIAQLEDWESMIAARRGNAAALTRRLDYLAEHLQTPAIRPECDHSFMMYPIVLRNEPKSGLVNFLEENGVETRDMLPLTNQPVYHELLGWKEDDYPVAKWINDNGFYVGIHQDLKQSELDYVADLIERYFRKQPTRTREGSCLLLTMPDDVEHLETMVEDMPLDMFDRVIAATGTAEHDALLERHGIEKVALEGESALDMAVRGSIAAEFDNLVFFQADGHHDPRDIGRLLLELERGNDMVIASRFLQGGARHDRAKRFRYRSYGHRGFTLFANLAFYGTLSDSMSTFRAVKRRRFAEAELTRSGLVGMYELSIRAMREDWKVAEIPTVEWVGRSAISKGRIFRSLFPLFRTLMRERGKRDRAADA